MPTKYCEKHQIWYDYRETCPECFKFTKLAADVVGTAVAVTIGGAILGGKKIHKKIQENKDAKIEEEKKLLEEINKPIQKKLYCTKCGNKLLGNIKFCTKCGTKL